MKCDYFTLIQAFQFTFLIKFFHLPFITYNTTNSNGMFSKEILSVREVRKDEKKPMMAMKNPLNITLYFVIELFRRSQTLPICLRKLLGAKEYLLQSKMIIPFFSLLLRTFNDLFIEFSGNTVLLSAICILIIYRQQMKDMCNFVNGLIRFPAYA